MLEPKERKIPRSPKKPIVYKKNEMQRPWSAGNVVYPVEIPHGGSEPQSQNHVQKNEKYLAPSHVEKRSTSYICKFKKNKGTKYLAM